MIRMVLLGVSFIAITAALLIFQPGMPRRDAAELPVAPVTRAEPSFAKDIPDPDPETATLGFPTGFASAPTANLTTTPPPVPTRDMAAPIAHLDDQSMRRLTWDTLSNLNQATGRDSAPGQPGSVLHTIVRRSLDDQSAPPAPSTEPRLYVVQPGDSLVSIAEGVYGDVNMTGPLFAANQAILSRPDDLRTGQTLVLPAQ